MARCVQLSGRIVTHPTRRGDKEESVSKVLSTCGFCGCGCGVFLEVLEGRVAGVAPQKAHPSSKGTLCFKGWNGFKVLGSPERLRAPFAKEGDTLHETTWPNAIKRVVQGFSDVIEKHGPGAVGVVGSTKITNEEAFLLSKLVRCGLGTNNVDTSVRLLHGPTLTVLPKIWGAAAGLGGMLDILESDTILLVGANPKDQNALAGSCVLRAAKNGVPLVVVDSRKTDLAHFATVHLQVKPGSDVWLLAALLRELLERGMNRVELPELDRLKATVLEATLERATEACGVAAEDIRHAAELLGKAERPAILYGGGVTQQENGSANVAFLADLFLLLGGGQTDGAVFLPLLLTNNAQGACDCGLLPGFLPGYARVDSPEDPARFSETWKCKLPTAPGLTLGEMLQAAREGKLKALYVVGENLLRSWPNTAAVDEALSKLDFLVVQDLFANETAQKADVVLPAAAYAEKDGTFTSIERRVQRVRKAVEPPDHARADWVILLDLLEAFGVKQKARKPADIFEEMTALMPIYQGLDWDEVGHTPGGVQWQVSVPENPALLVPKIREAKEKTDESLPLLAFVGRPPFHWNTGTLVERAHTLIREYPVSEVLINPADARERKLRTGMPVRVKTRVGSVKRMLRVSKDVPAGTLFLPVHFRDGLTTSVLSDTLEPESKVPAMRVVAANLEKLG